MSNFTVRRGRRYRATIRLGLIEQLADNETIAAQLRAAGLHRRRRFGERGQAHAEALWPNGDASAPLAPADHVGRRAGLDARVARQTARSDAASGR